ncbi:hypothetical protein ACX9R5_00245 [Rathayibacter sp. CAU 1779]
MGGFTDRMRSVLHWPSRKKPVTPAQRKQENRWEGEGGALHPTDDHDETHGDSPER